MNGTKNQNHRHQSAKDKIREQVAGGLPGEHKDKIAYSESQAELYEHGGKSIWVSRNANEEFKNERTDELRQLAKFSNPKLLKNKSEFEELAAVNIDHAAATRSQKAFETAVRFRKAALRQRVLDGVVDKQLILKALNTDIEAEKMRVVRYEKEAILGEARLTNYDPVDNELKRKESAENIKKDETLRWTAQTSNSEQKLLNVLNSILGSNITYATLKAAATEGQLRR